VAYVDGRAKWTVLPPEGLPGLEPTTTESSAPMGK
jgi:hypothetical protein